MSTTRQRAKGRRESGSFVKLPHAVWRHPKFAALSPYALKLLIDIAGLYNGQNNGDLAAPYSTLSRDRHWCSRDTLGRALAELLQSGFLLCTRRGKQVKGYGGKHYPNLYAVTWWSIDRSEQHTMTTNIAPQTWLKDKQNPDTEAGIDTVHQYRSPVLEPFQLLPELTNLCGVPRHGRCSPDTHTVHLLRILPRVTSN